MIRNWNIVQTTIFGKTPCEQHTMVSGPELTTKDAAIQKFLTLPGNAKTDPALLKAKVG